MSEEKMRIWEQMKLEKAVTLLLAGKKIVKGTTEDIDTEGVSILTQLPQKHIQVGDRGTMRIDNYDSVEFPFTIAKVNSFGVALDLGSSHGTFSRVLVSAFCSDREDCKNHQTA
ncbi:MAG: hypothetical protein HQL69_19540 [Magnetococcales bacterium]|nr:hypothetical protein [Magnetococcales bacterium]